MAVLNESAMECATETDDVIEQKDEQKETPSSDEPNDGKKNKSNTISAIDKTSVHKICSGQVC